MPPFIQGKHYFNTYIDKKILSEFRILCRKRGYKINKAIEIMIVNFLKSEEIKENLDNFFKIKV